MFCNGGLESSSCMSEIASLLSETLLPAEAVDVLGLAAKLDEVLQ